jgi:hypothetical protein
MKRRRTDALYAVPICTALALALAVVVIGLVALVVRLAQIHA